MIFFFYFCKVLRTGLDKYYISSFSFISYILLLLLLLFIIIIIIIIIITTLGSETVGGT